MRRSIVSFVSRHAPAWEWVFRPTYNPNSNTTTGYLRISDAVYRVREIHFNHDDESAGRLWQLDHDGTQYQIVRNPATAALVCDCPGAEFTQRACEHVNAIESAYGLMDCLSALESFDR
ncbi:MAG: hypothetical protein ACJ8C4_13385 [Gemmataceae bacterium]